MAPEFSVRMHDWRIEPREYARQEERRGRRHAFQQLVPSRTALVVIDMIPFFVSQSAYCRGIVLNVVRLADGLRAAGGLVAWVVPSTEQRHPALAKEFFGEAVAELYRTSAGEGPPASRLWPAFTPHDARSSFVEKDDVQRVLSRFVRTAGASGGTRRRHGAGHRNCQQYLLRIVGPRRQCCRLQGGDGG